MTRNPASFRDPSGYIFTHNSLVHRQITPFGLASYKSLMDTGLYEVLVKKNYLISHQELPESIQGEGITIKPEQLSFVSYPYEWSFAQLKDAALLTLYIQMEALKLGQSLKDASAYNVQFHNGRPVFIDTLSFETYEVGKPWVAYKQFCQHFLAPLALSSFAHIGGIKMLQSYIDGIPLDLTSSMLPPKTKLNLRLLTHIHWHSKSQKKYANHKSNSNGKKGISKMGMLGLVDSLINTVKKLTWNPAGTEWGDYYTFTNYEQKAFELKKDLVRNWIDSVKPETVWDLGANDGTFSRIASDSGISTVAFDIDPIAVEKNYRKVRKSKEKNILPLILDLTNPSPAIGWANTERQNIEQRGPADLVMALALVHHLAISNNLPLDSVAEYLSKLGQNVIIEFVPKGDSQVDILLATRKDIFDNYHEVGFEEAFKPFFYLVEKQPIEGTKRTMYLFKTK